MHSVKPESTFKGYSKNVIDFYQAGNLKYASMLKPVSLQPAFKGHQKLEVAFSPGVMSLSPEKRLTRTQALQLYNNCQDKKQEIKEYKEDIEGYTNSRAGVVEAASIMGENGKNYTACNVDFFSSRWGMSAGMIASIAAISDLNQKINAIAVTDLNHDRKSLQWLANTHKDLESSRGGRDLQVVSEYTTPGGKTKLYVQTLNELKGFISKDLPEEKPYNKPAPIPGKVYKTEDVNITAIEMSDSAKTRAKELQNKGINVEEMIKTLAQSAQQEANKIEKYVYETGGAFDNAPNSHYHFHTSLLADNGKVYTGTNVEFYDNGFLSDAMCSERAAVANAVNDGANKALILFVTNNQNHKDVCCAECLGWLSTKRGGSDLLLPAFERDEQGNKTGKVIVKTLQEYLPGAYKPSPKVG